MTIATANVNSGGVTTTDNRNTITSGNNFPGFKDIAEVIENTITNHNGNGNGNGNGIGHCLEQRTTLLSTISTGLGPPDLVHIVKSSSVKEYGSFHHVLGVDTSSSATIAAYVNSLSYALPAEVSWLRNQTTQWRVTRGVYCVYDAFSKVDLRVEARMPGGVTAYSINSQGVRSTITPEMWHRAYISGILRHIWFCNDKKTEDQPSQFLRIMEDSQQQQEKFLDVATKLFWQGLQLGPAKGQIYPNIVNNYLSQGILVYFLKCQQPQIAIEFFKQFQAQDPQVTSLIATLLLAADREPEAIIEMHKAATANNNLKDSSPPPSTVLAMQAHFLIEKKEFELALKIAKYAVQIAPMDYETWICLAKTFIKMRNYSQAIIAINTCPITSLGSLDPLQGMVKPTQGSRLWNPVKATCTTNTISKDNVLENLSGPVKDVYSLLVEIVDIIGWDDFLSLRSQLFIMQEEHRHGMLRQVEEMSKIPAQVSTSPELGIRRVSGHLQPVPLTTSNSDDLTSNQVLKKKRLCERWLDHLFLILYEDMRIYTIYKTEVQQNSNANQESVRPAREWLLLGRLCKRLHRFDEAKEALRRSVEDGSCHNGWMDLMDIYGREGRLAHALTAVTKVIETCVDAKMMKPFILTLIKEHGADRVKSTMMALNLQSSTCQDTILSILQYSNQIKSLGYDF